MSPARVYDYLDPDDGVLEQHLIVDVVDHDAHHFDQFDDPDHDVDDDNDRNHAARHGYYFYDKRWRGARRHHLLHHRDRNGH
jgi:hypothetical protein